MKAQFNDEYIHPDHEPLDSTTYDFDWDSLYAALNEPDLSPADHNTLKQVLERLLKWIVTRESGNGPHSAKMIARRTFALLWVINPTYFESGVSLSLLAKHLGLHKQSLSILAAEATRRFGVQNSHQTHGWNRHE